MLRHGLDDGGTVDGCSDGPAVVIEGEQRDIVGGLRLVTDDPGERLASGSLVAVRGGDIGCVAAS